MATGQLHRTVGVNLLSRFGIASALTFGQDPEHTRHESLRHEAMPRAGPPGGYAIRMNLGTGVNLSSRFGITPALTSG